ncbi:MAG: RNA-binding protein, partial [Saprospiraceae bacterium]
VYLGYYEGDKCFPVRGRQCSSEQMPFVKKKFKNYNEFGTATVLDVLDGRISESTVVQEAQIFANTVFINNGGIFSAQALPNEAQIAPVYGIAVDDFDGDGKSEAFLAGNMYNREVETTRSDAGKGCLISFDSEGSIKVDRTLATGVSADKDVRDVLSLKSDDYSLLVIANNNDPVQFYRY